ncbi:MAG: 1-acyl-sn-glycerol-3-phosphate acyltransferase [Ruminococcaceae bacterium]|nr:1-acyl-sn-glycerol-3-phosphate acyltransferase [Oscillospiraceae bacterium]
MNRFFIGFVKFTGWLPQLICFRTKTYYQNKNIQGRNLQGPAILISNHTSVFDYAVFLFTFRKCILRYQMAEIMFKKNKFVTFTLNNLGGILVDRNSHDFTFMGESEDILYNGGVVGIFPEGRLPLKGEERPLPFRPGASYLAMKTGVPVIPIYTNGSYFQRKRARIIIGTPIHPEDHINSDMSDKDKIQELNTVFRNKIVELEHELKRQTKK